MRGSNPTIQTPPCPDVKQKVMSLDHLPGLKEATEMAHLPSAGDGQDHQLNNSPCHGVSVGRLTLVTELSLVVLLISIVKKTCQLNYPSSSINKSSSTLGTTLCHFSEVLTRRYDCSRLISPTLWFKSRTRWANSNQCWKRIRVTRKDGS